LLRNANLKFVCKNVFIKGEDGEALMVPIAHGEGRYYADESTLKQLEANNQIIYRYCDADGNITTEANPNGTTDSIAGICNAGGNVFGMMPHPERACSEALGNTDGRKVFKALLIKNLQLVKEPELV
jgi:phosphoribosylformylglycinamidine synthase subunit PurQ / glutaminase